MTLCIAACCRSYEGSLPSVVLCCDERGNRGLVSADTSEKIKWVGDYSAVMLAGPSNEAQDMFIEILDPLTEYDNWIQGKLDPSNDDEIEKRLTALKNTLADRVRAYRQKLRDRYIEDNLFMSTKDFLESGRSKFGDAHFQELHTDIKMVGLQAEMLVCTFVRDNGVVICVSRDCRAIEVDHFGVIGSGRYIAEGFYVQRECDDFINLRECVYRVWEAKTASEKNSEVGPTTVIEIITKGKPRRTLTDKQFSFLQRTIERRISALPKLEGLKGKLESLEHGVVRKG